MTYNCSRLLSRRSSPELIFYVAVVTVIFVLANETYSGYSIKRLIYKKDKLSLDSICDSVRSNVSVWPSMESDNHIMFSYYVHEESKTMMCIPPKTGHEFWVEDLRDLVDGFRLTPLALYTVRERLHRLKSYSKVAFLREPFRRIWSGYNDRLVRPHEYMSSTGLSVVKKVRGESPNRTCAPDVTFREFASYLVQEHRQGLDFNHHWETFLRLCRPCSVNYDYIGHMETFDEDFPAIKEILGLPSTVGVDSIPIARAQKELLNLYGERVGLLKCLSFDEYARGKWAAFVNRGLVSPDQALPSEFYKPVDIIDRTERKKYNQRLKDHIFDKLKQDVLKDKSIVTARRQHVVYSAIRALPKDLRCALYNVYKADFHIFGYSNLNYGLTDCESSKHT